MTDAVRAAGGVVWRRADEDLEVVLIHRARYDDWTFPKGKNDPGETDEACALREVEEEVGLRCRLGAELPSTSYRMRDGHVKRVRYWAMEPVSGELRPRAGEVDAARWVAIADASEALTYDRDRIVLSALDPPISK